MYLLLLYFYFFTYTFTFTFTFTFTINKTRHIYWSILECFVLSVKSPDNHIVDRNGNQPSPTKDPETKDNKGFDNDAFQAEKIYEGNEIIMKGNISTGDAQAMQKATEVSGKCFPMTGMVYVAQELSPS